MSIEPTDLVGDFMLLAFWRQQENERRLLECKPPLVIEFPLTEEQMALIKPHLDYAGLQHAAGKPGMVLALVAQVGHPLGMIKIGARYIPHELAEQLKERGPGPMPPPLP